MARHSRTAGNGRYTPPTRGTRIRNSALALGAAVISSGLTMGIESGAGASPAPSPTISSKTFYACIAEGEIIGVEAMPFTAQFCEGQGDSGVLTQITGPQGFQGAQGTQGFQGVQGFQGNQGNQGHQGLTGSQGSQGFQGFQGLTGSQGSQGLRGVQGFQGNNGTNGAQGGQGSQGSTGAQGNQGFLGNQGNTGANGTQGFQGNQGVTGSQGIQGFQGTQGVQGFQGFQGAQGGSGAQGPQGFQGLTGAGTQGPQGVQGFQGFQGVAGTGAQGAQGAQGSQGFQGNQGSGSTTTYQGNGELPNAAPNANTFLMPLSGSSDFPSTDSVSSGDYPPPAAPFAQASVLGPLQVDVYEVTTGISLSPLVTVTLYVAPAPGPSVPVWSATTITCTAIFQEELSAGDFAASCSNSVDTVSVTAGETAYYQVSVLDPLGGGNFYVTTSLGAS